MRFHILGAGSIGSLLAANLAELPQTTVRLMVRRKDHLKKLLVLGDQSSGASADDVPLASLRIERDGLARRTDGLEIELLATEDDRRASSNNLYHPKFRSGTDRALELARNDPIDTLFITTKANQTLPALRNLVPRLSSASTVVLCQNGMGTLERILDRYWPDDTSAVRDPYGVQRSGGRPSFVCATTSHGMWRKADGVYVHAGRGDIKFGVVPNGAVLAALAVADAEMHSNPLVNPRSLTPPSLTHIPPSIETLSLRNTISALLDASELRASWLPLPTLQIAQLQKLCVNASVNALTAVMGVLNGALVGSPRARSIVESVAAECALVFAAHLAREEGRWQPPPLPSAPASPSSSRSLSHSSIPRHSRSRPPQPTPPPLPASHPLSASSLLSYTFTVLFKTSENVSSTLADMLSTSPVLSPSLPSPSSPTSTEINFMHGYIEALGRRYDIPTPVVSALGTMVKLKEEMIRCGAADMVVERALVRIDQTHARRASSIFTRVPIRPLRSGIDDSASDDLPEPKGVHPFDRAKRVKSSRALWRDRDARLDAGRAKERIRGG